jgi:hypothetical protein
MEETIYFFSGNLIVGNENLRFISGIYEKQVNTKESAMELLKEIEALIINQVRKRYPLEKISFQINNISILGKLDINDKIENDWNIIENALTDAYERADDKNELPTEYSNKLLALGYTAEEVKKIMDLLLI